MNKLTAISVNYLRPSRTIETILLENIAEKRILYVYNYEGIHFRVFNFISELLEFFDDKYETNINFETQADLDKYLLELNLSKVKLVSLISI